MRSSDSRPVKLRSKGELRALVFIANPSNLETDFRSLARVEVEAERARAQASLGSLITREIPSRNETSGYATLNNLFDALRDGITQHGGYDILYIVCHSMLRKKNRDADISEEPYLLLEKEDGTADLVGGVDLVSPLRSLSQQPWLVVLASCQSAGKGDGMPAPDRQDEPRTGDIRGALAALGPRLAEAGVPAVLAMQGSILIETMERFTSEFFKQLSVHGQIDLAAGVARSAVLRTQHDWWMPILFLRLREGRIWYVPGFRTNTFETFEKWPIFLRRIRRETRLDRCTPILGSGLLDQLLGSSRNMAREWAQAYGFPMAPTSQEDLPKVAQYLATKYDNHFPYDEFVRYVCEKIKQRYGNHLAPALQEASVEQINELMKAAATQLWYQDPDEPHRVLARLPFEIYITTNPDNLLALALTEANKAPRVEVCPWNEHLMQTQETAFSPEINGYLR